MSPEDVSDAPEHAFELQPAELLASLDGASLDAAAVAERAARRQANLTLDPPATLGPEELLPALGPAPAPLRRAAAAILITNTLLDTDLKTEPLTGTGIGDRIVRGRARVAADPGEALALLEPGEVLVVPFTTPAYNAVLPIVAGLVVEEGGALSHAALVARELDIPAVIGVPGATRASSRTAPRSKSIRREDACTSPTSTRRPGNQRPNDVSQVSALYNR